MKNLFKTTLLTTALATSLAANAADTIGFVDPNYVMQNHPVLLDATAKFEKFMKDSQNQFGDEDRKLAAENKRLTEERSKINADAQKLQKEQEAVESSIKKKVAQLEKDLENSPSNPSSSSRQA